MAPDVIAVLITYYCRTSCENGTNFDLLLVTLNLKWYLACMLHTYSLK